MAVITKTIGTAGRDYSTITSWEADLDDFSTVYSNNDDAVGECYADSDFSEQAVINGGGTSMTGLNSITLTVATSDRHDGTAGTGVKMVNNSALSVYSDKNINISWLEMNQSGTTYGSTFSMIYIHNNSYYQKISNMLLHDVTGASSIYPLHVKYGHPTLANNIVYNVTHTGPYRGYGINASTLRESHVYNNTVYNIQGTHPSAAYNFGINVSYNYNIKNNISVEVGSAVYSGCFGQAATSNTSNNMSSDTTAPGSDSLTEVTTANQFVSIVAGSEDLHLASGSEAVGAGVNLGSSDPVVQYDIDGAYRGTVWDMGADQTPATITKSIGTSSRDYSTITAWEADLDTQGVYANGDSAVGECYNDSNFIYTHEGGQLNINGGVSVGLNSVTLTVPSSDRHDGTLGTGTTILADGTTSKETVQIFINNCTIEWLSIEVDGIGSYSNGNGINYTLNATGGGYTSGGTIRNNIVRGENQPKAVNGSAALIDARSHEIRVYNNIVFDGYNATDSSGIGIYSAYGNTNQFIYNNTAYNCGTNIYSAAVNPTFKNNLAVGKQAAGDFNITSSSSHSNNLSSDGTADDYGGTDHIVNAVTANQFISIVAGAEDLHLAGSSDAIKAGVVLTEPEGIEYDIDGQVRAGLWDIGADQTVSGHIRRTLLGIG